jgi:predicted molibdopterin-dependent oxidoreductase YjgC
LRGHNNVQGVTEMGALPDRLPGYQLVSDPEVHDRFEKSWNVTFPRTRGLDNHEMVDAIFDGKLKAMYLYGEEMSLVDANANLVGDAFSKLQFLVVQEIFFSDNCRYADVILPAAPSLEKEGTFTNTEARIQRLYQVFEPLAETRPDWQIIQDVANMLGANWNYRHPSEIMQLNNGRLLEHFHEGNMTYRVNGIKEKTPDTWIEISPARALVTDRVEGRVGIISITNAAGRLLWACLSDAIGRRNVFLIMFFVQAILFLLMPAQHEFAILVSLAFVVLSCYGGGFGTMPAFASDFFGAKALGSIYGLMLTAWGLAAVFGPLLVVQIREATGSYSGALTIIACVMLASSVLPLIVVARRTVGSPIRIR